MEKQLLWLTANLDASISRPSGGGPVAEAADAAVRSASSSGGGVLAAMQLPGIRKPNGPESELLRSSYYVQHLKNLASRELMRDAGIEFTDSSLTEEMNAMDAHIDTTATAGIPPGVEQVESANESTNESLAESAGQVVAVDTAQESQLDSVALELSVPNDPSSIPSPPPGPLSRPAAASSAEEAAGLVGPSLQQRADTTEPDPALGSAVASPEQKAQVLPAPESQLPLVALVAEQSEQMAEPALDAEQSEAEVSTVDGKVRRRRDSAIVRSFVH